MLYEQLSRYHQSGAVPFHMPGHKRNTSLLGDGLPYNIDITEIAGFDDLHDPKGVLKALSALAAELYGCRAAFPLVNGATGGLLAAVAESGETRRHRRYGAKLPQSRLQRGAALRPAACLSPTQRRTAPPVSPGA